MTDDSDNGDDSGVLETVWTDPVTGRRGYLVIERLVDGLASGGLRVREGCTLAEVRGLARAMTRKEALVFDPRDRYRPLGGAKGGLDVDPGDPGAHGVLRRFLEALLPVIRTQWCFGEDLGVRQQTLDALAAELGLGSTIDALYTTLDDAPAARERLVTASAVLVDGVPLIDLVGGYGVARAALLLGTECGLEPAGTTAVVQGFGSIGGAAARYLARSGVRVVAIADAAGLVRDDAGLDVEALLRRRDDRGVIDRQHLPAGVTLEHRDRWLEQSCDLLVPAATSAAISAAAAARVRARLVVEGANLPTTADAEAALLARGIPVVPDFLANAMTNAWWWWVVFGDIEPTAEAAFAKIDAVMARLVHEITAMARDSSQSWRACALDLAERHIAALSAGVRADPS